MLTELLPVSKPYRSCYAANFDLLYFLFFIDQSAFAVRPMDTVAVAGVITVLHCSINFTLSTAISWSRLTLSSRELLNSRRMTSADRMLERLIVDGCNVMDEFTDDYSVEYNTPRGQCDLMFNYVTLNLAGIYRCIGQTSEVAAAAKFTVLCEFCFCLSKVKVKCH